MAAGCKPAKVLLIGNYPPPMCGWAMQIYLVAAELRRRGQVCDVLKINENRNAKSTDYIDVQGGWDYLVKVVRSALRGYRLNVHVNGTSKKGYLLAMLATITGRLAFRPTALTFHGGLSQPYFPRHDSRGVHYAFRLLFHIAGRIACDSVEIKRAIEGYRIKPQKITAVSTFSPQYLRFSPAPLTVETEKFLSEHDPVFFSYLSFRPEYRLEVVRQGMKQFRGEYAQAGFIWLGFPDRELRRARAFVDTWSEEERGALLLLGNLPHDQFLTLLTRCEAYLRSPECDGVAASVLEALALGVPVVATENGRRPEGVITYRGDDPADMCAQMISVAEKAKGNGERTPPTATPLDIEDGVARMADWLCGKAL